MLGKNLNKNAFILFNAGIDMSEEEVQEFVDDLPEKYIYQKNFYILKTNTLIIMQKIVWCEAHINYIGHNSIKYSAQLSIKFSLFKKLFTFVISETQ